MKRYTNAYLKEEQKWVGKRVECKALRGSHLKACWEEIFQGVVTCIHSDEADSTDAWIRPLDRMSVLPDEIIGDSIEVDVFFHDAKILE